MVNLHTLPEEVKSFTNQNLITETQLIQILPLQIDLHFQPWLTTDQVRLLCAMDMVRDRVPGNVWLSFWFFAEAFRNIQKILRVFPDIPENTFRKTHKMCIARTWKCDISSSVMDQIFCETFFSENREGL